MDKMFLSPKFYYVLFRQGWWRAPRCFGRRCYQHDFHTIDALGTCMHCEALVEEAYPTVTTAVKEVPKAGT